MIIKFKSIHPEDTKETTTHPDAHGVESYSFPRMIASGAKIKIEGNSPSLRVFRVVGDDGGVGVDEEEKGSAEDSRTFL